MSSSDMVKYFSRHGIRFQLIPDHSMIIGCLTGDTIKSVSQSYNLDSFDLETVVCELHKRIQFIGSKGTLKDGRDRARLASTERRENFTGSKPRDKR